MNEIRFDPARSSLGGSSRRGPHRLAAALGCPINWALRYIDGHRPKEEPTFRLGGTLIHTGVAVHHALQMKQPPPWFDLLGRGTVEQRIVQAVSMQAQGRPDDIRAALAVTEAYRDYDVGRPWTTLMVEYEFMATMGEVWALRHSSPCPPDVIDELVSARTDWVGLINGYFQMVDHKTLNPRNANNSLGTYRDHHEHFWQAAVNKLVATAELKRSGGPEVESFNIQRITRSLPLDVSIDAILLPTVAMDEIPRAMVTALRQERQLMAWIDGGEKLPRHFHQCYGRFGNCDFVNVCHATSKQEQLAVLANDFYSVT